MVRYLPSPPQSLIASTDYPTRLVVPSGSVDHAFDWYPTRDARQSHSIRQDSTGHGQQWPPTTHFDWNGPGMTGDNFDQTTDLNSERGLYWLWDMSWNGGNV